MNPTDMFYESLCNINNSFDTNYKIIIKDLKRQMIIKYRKEKRKII